MEQPQQDRLFTIDGKPTQIMELITKFPYPKLSVDKLVYAKIGDNWSIDGHKIECIQHPESENICKKENSK